MFRSSQFYSFLHLLLLSCFIQAQPYDYPSAALSTKWTNTASANHSIEYVDGTTIRSVLLRSTSGYGPRYACGFYCNGTCTDYVFAIFIVYVDSGAAITLPSSGFPQVVWSANRNSPVKINSTLELQEDGNLVLKEVNGEIAWATNTRGKLIAGLNLTEEGNLVLFNNNNATVWQSFDHPTDSLVPGQRLGLGQKLTASASSTDWTELPLLSFNLTNEGLFGLMETNPPQLYYSNLFTTNLVSSQDTIFIQYLNGSLSLFLKPELSTVAGALSGQYMESVIAVPVALSAQYMKLGSDGHLRVYEWFPNKWTQVADLLESYLGDCAYPLVCGEYGICSNGQCSCPAISSNTTTYFRPVSEKNPNLGCSAITALSCGPTVVQSLVELSDIYYFSMYYDYDTSPDRNPESCKQRCLETCSCKAAIFEYGTNSSQGSCYLPSQVFSLMNNVQDRTHYNSTAYIKVQNSSGVLRVSPTSSGPSAIPIILGITIGAVFVVIIVVIVYFVWRRKHVSDDDEEDYLDQFPGMPTRYSYEELKTDTENFSKKLGAGGFGSVYEGTHDAIKIAVKQLEGLGRIKESFLAEVESIGSIHHVNLVRLMGFCAEKSHRLLVYEYMANGSLDRWIYQNKNESALQWKQRKKIIVDIAKGLNYLHEDCRQKIIHLDIKPQNILLDEHFNAKVSDFGLSKLIDRDQSQVVTTMRGTPGYIAPDWLSAVISEKVDVYSFGVVILEIVCGRRVFDSSLEEDDMHLLGVFKRKAEEGRLADIVDKSSEDMELNESEALEMMRLSAWCLQGDSVKRPSMPMVIKVLEGVSAVPSDLDYNFFDPTSSKWPKATVGGDGGFGDFTPLLASVLSSPR